MMHEVVNYGCRSKTKLLRICITNKTLFFAGFIQTYPDEIQRHFKGFSRLIVRTILTALLVIYGSII